MQIPADFIRLQRGPAHAALAAFVVAAAVAGLLGGSFAAFTGTTSNEASTFSAKRIFPGDHSLAARDFRDASSGGPANRSDPLSFADGLETRSQARMPAGSGRYLEFELQSFLPAGLAASGVAANVRIASQSGTGSACHWLELLSGGATIATYGSEASPLGCSTGTTQTTVTTPLPAVTSTDLVNGLALRVHAWETNGRRVDVDMVTVTGATPYAPFTVYERMFTDASVSPAAVTTWVLSASDGSAYTTSANWRSGGPSATRYVERAYNLAVPAGASIGTATLTHVWHSTVTTESCYYVEVLHAGGVIATYGSAAAPAGCSAGTAFVTDTIALPAVDSAAKANDLTIRMYGWMNVSSCGGGGRPPCGRWVEDEVRVAVSYHLD
jgi:hypothetical protein